MHNTTSLVRPISYNPSLTQDGKIVKYLIDTLGGSPWDETYEQTLGYRWRGEDTLTWGNVDEWILVKWFVQQYLIPEQLTTTNVWDVVYQARIARLETKYIFRNPIEIKKFLIEHQEVLSILWDARPVVEEFFGNNVSIALEVVHDPEAKNLKQLFGYIHVESLLPEETFKRFTAFDEAWFLKQYKMIGGLFNFNLE